MTARKADIANLPDWPRLLSREQAAAYCGVSVNHFTEHFPGEATRMGGRKLYDIKVVNEWIDSLSSRGEDDDEKWLARLGNDNPPKARASGRG